MQHTYRVNYDKKYFEDVLHNISDFIPYISALHKEINLFIVSLCSSCYLRGLLECSTEFNISK